MVGRCAGSPSVDALRFDLLTDSAKFFQRVFDDGHIGAANFMEPPPTSRDQRLPIADKSGVEVAFGKRVRRRVEHDGIEFGIDDELSHRRVAADVAFWSRMQRLGVNHSDHKAQVEIAVDDFLNFTAADVAEIALFALRHSADPLSPATTIPGFWRPRRFQSPRTSAMAYMPGDFPATNFAAASAPIA